MTGFFPIMMFALPAAALAIWHEAKPAQKKAVGGIMLSAALTSFLTGVTEPLEFAFMFVAWPLYVIHAVLTGTSLALVNALGIKDGFGFSAGLFDYVLNFNIATKPLLLILIGLGYAVIYYFPFRFVIRKWNLRTPGPRGGGRGVDRRSRTRLPEVAADHRWQRRVVTPARVFAPGWVHVEGEHVDGRRAAARRRRPRRRGAPRRDGGARASSTRTCTAAAARRSTPATAEAAETVVAAHLAARHHHDDGQPGHRHASTALARVGRASSAALVDDGRLAGIHLEGPWLSPAARRRARPGAAARPDAGRRRPAGSRPAAAPADGHAGARAARRRSTPSAG